MVSNFLGLIFIIVVLQDLRSHRQRNGDIVHRVTPRQASKVETGIDFVFGWDFNFKRDPFGPSVEH